MPGTLTWHGHANFQIQSENCTLLIDPFFTHNPTATITPDAITPPDVVLVTHLHGDHEGDAVTICQKHGSRLGAVVGSAQVLQQRGVPEGQIIGGIGFNIGGTATEKGVSITMTQAFHTSDAGMPVGYIITLQDGFTIYHAGDTGIFSSMELYGSLYSIDLALLPAGGFYTMDARAAALAAKLLKAKAVIPMHWGTFPALAQNMDEFDAALASFAPACRHIALKPGESLNLPC